MQKKLLIYLKHRYEFWCIKESQVNVLQKKFPALKIVVAKEEAEAIAQIQDADFYFGWHLPVHFLGAAKKLVWVHTPSAGRDYIDSPELRARPIEFTNSEGYHGLFMAQHAMSMILYFSRGLSLSHEQFWQRDKVAQRFFDLIGSKILIVGCGSIGLKLAELAKAFGMDILGYRRQTPIEKGNLVHWVSKENLVKAMGEAKIIVNLLPGTEETYHYFNYEVFSAFQKGSVFINLGRGRTVNEMDLLKVLDTDILLGCGLDVLEKEPPEGTHPLYHHKKVLITPHSSAFSYLYLDKAVEYYCELIMKKKELIEG